MELMLAEQFLLFSRRIAWQLSRTAARASFTNFSG